MSLANNMTETRKRRKEPIVSYYTQRDLASLIGEKYPLPPSYRVLLQRYPFRITAYYRSLFLKANVADPLFRQCIPDLKELEDTGGKDDPLEEERFMPLPNLIHRYPDRCLLIMTTECFVFCRHCNRKRRWKERMKINPPETIEAMLRYIADRPKVREVIISGGDPLTLKDNFLDWFLGRLRMIHHVEVIRLGSRAPVVAPMRITKRLTGILKKYRPLWFNTQFNHPREITEAAKEACDRIISAGIPLSNQSVLLKGINDDYEVMKELLYGLQRMGVRPYYLFHCDAVAGTGHFWVDIEKGITMMEALRRDISGLCLPRYVLDSPSPLGKIPLCVP